MRCLIVLVACLSVQLMAVPNAAATTISYYFEAPTFESVSIGYGEDLPGPYDPAQDSAYLETALRDYAHYIAGLRASFAIDWDYFGGELANLTVSVWEPQWDRPEWLVFYNPPGNAEGLVIDYFGFGTDAAGELAWFNMVSWDIPPFFSVAWINPLAQGAYPWNGLEFYNGFATWVYEPETMAEVAFYAPPGGKLGIGAWPSNPALSPVPLPAAALLLLSALLGLMGLRCARPALLVLHSRRSTAA